MDQYWQPNLENELIIIRPLLGNDLESLYKVASDQRIWEQHPAKERSEVEGFKKFFRESLQSGGAVVIVDKETNEMIGSSRYYPVIDYPDKIEIGWSFLAPAYWGGTYNRSMKSLMVNYALDRVGEVLFYVARDNIRSQRAMMKIGGYLIDHVERGIDPKDENNIIFSIDKKFY